MKLKKSDVNILLIVLGIGAALLTYFLVFTKLNDKTDTLKIQNASLQQEVDRLQDLANNKQKYLDDTATMQDEIENIKAQFAAAYQPEDEILYVDNLEKNFDTTANAINMPGTSPVEVVTTADTSAEQMRQTQQMQLMQQKKLQQQQIIPQLQVQLLKSCCIRHLLQWISLHLIMR